MTPQLLLPPSTTSLADFHPYYFGCLLGEMHMYQVLYNVTINKLEDLLNQELKNPEHGSIHR